MPFSACWFWRHESPKWPGSWATSLMESSSCLREALLPVVGWIASQVCAHPEPRDVNFFGNRVIAGVNPMAQQLLRRQGIYLQRIAGASLSLALDPIQNRQLSRSLGLKVNKPGVTRPNEDDIAPNPEDNCMLRLVSLAVGGARCQ